MIVYNVGDKIKIKETTGALGVKLEKGMEGIVVGLFSGRVEAAFEGLGLVSVNHELIKKKVRKTERFVKAKNVKITDEVCIPGSGTYNKVSTIYRDDYESAEPAICVETVGYDSKDYTYNELVGVRR